MMMKKEKKMKMKMKVGKEMVMTMNLAHCLSCWPHSWTSEQKRP